jgi:2-polyprenyl-3-methyl-5-hydroxy-6-metoxy-1,4-benzoquinol methylase
MIQLRQQNINTPEHWNSVFLAEIHDNHDRIADDRFNTTIELINNGQSILDIGCGRGEFIDALMLQRPNCEAVGIDFSSAAIDNAKTKGIVSDFFVHDINTAYQYSHKFDIVVSFEVIEHLSNPTMLVENARANLNQSGFFILTTPFENMVYGGDEHMYSFTFTDIINLLSPSFDIITMSRYYRNYSNLYVLSRLK